ncbi:hypothetical protein EMCRGX_G001118 [Ephydatia muelleri]
MQIGDCITCFKTTEHTGVVDRFHPDFICRDDAIVPCYLLLLHEQSASFVLHMQWIFQRPSTTYLIHSNLVHGIPMPALRAKACAAPIWLIIPACFSSSSLSALSSAPSFQCFPRGRF